jgi:hypothetical protein
VATIPAIFMTAVVTTFIANSGIGFNLPMNGRHQHRHRQRRGGDGGLFLESQADSIANCRNTGGALRGRCEFDLSLLETNHQGGNAYQGRFPTEGKEEIQ